MRLVARHPWRYVFSRWNYKAAITSALFRAQIFFAVNAAAGLDAASRPSWFIPGAQPPVPVTTPAPTPAVTAPRATATARPATPSPKGTR